MNCSVVLVLIPLGFSGLTLRSRRVTSSDLWKKPGVAPVLLDERSQLRRFGRSGVIFHTCSWEDAQAQTQKTLEGLFLSH